MQTKYIIAISIAALAISFATGRWLAPVKTVTITKVVTVESKKDDKTTNEEEHTKTTTTEKVNPDGSKTVTTVTTTDKGSKSVDKSSDNTESNSESSKTVEKSKSRLLVLGMAGVPVQFGTQTKLIYGGQVYKEILGPIGLGVWYLSNNTGGLSVGISF